MRTYYMLVYLVLCLFSTVLLQGVHSLAFVSIDCGGEILLVNLNGVCYPLPEEGAGGAYILGIEAGSITFSTEPDCSGTTYTYKETDSDWKSFGYSIAHSYVFLGTYSIPPNPNPPLADKRALQSTSDVFTVYSSLQDVRIWMGNFKYKIDVLASIPGSNCFSWDYINGGAASLSTQWDKGNQNGSFIIGCASFQIVVSDYAYSNTLYTFISSNFIRAAIRRAGYWVMGSIPIQHFEFQICDEVTGAIVVTITINSGAIPTYAPLNPPTLDPLYDTTEDADLYSYNENLGLPLVSEAQFHAAFGYNGVVDESGGMSGAGYPDVTDNRVYAVPIPGEKFLKPVMYNWVNITSEKVRIVSAFADITQNVLGKGTGTNQGARDFAHSQGLSTDDAGHVLGACLGGSGKQLVNIWPQAPDFNRGRYRFFETFISNCIQNGTGQASLSWNFGYPRDDSTRPSTVRYCANFGGPEPGQLCAPTDCSCGVCVDFTNDDVAQGCNTVCGASDKCCLDNRLGSVCYNPLTHECLPSSEGGHYLCGINEGVCGGWCYDTAHYYCGGSVLQQKSG